MLRISPHIPRMLRIPRTYYAPLRMYRVTEIASSRRVGSCGFLSSHPLHLPAHTTLRCVCTGLRRWRLPDAWGHGLSILASHASPAHTTLRCVCTGLQRWRLPDAWGHGLSILASPASPAHTPLRCVCTGLRRWRLPGSPHILRFAAYVRGYRDSVFQSPRTYYAPLCMYGVTEMASSRRVGSCGSLSSHPPHLPAHTTLRCVCTGLRK